MSDDLDGEAERLLLSMTRARRRPKLRVAEPLYDAEDAQIETPFGAVQAWRLGEGPAVLLVHGWEDDNALWGPMIDAFQERGRAVVAFDLPGHGYSPAEEASFWSARAAVRAVAEALGPIDAIVAHSFGCPSSVGALLDGLSVERIAMIATPVPSKEGRGRRSMGGSVSPEVFARAAELYRERTGREYGGFDFAEAAPKMTIPALFLHSLDDEQCPADRMREISPLWPGAEEVLLDGLGHRLIAQDDEVIDAVVSFIDG